MHSCSMNRRYSTFVYLVGTKEKQDKHNFFQIKMKIILLKWGKKLINVVNINLFKKKVKLMCI